MDDEKLTRLMTAPTIAVAALAEALVRAGLISADRLIALLREPSGELLKLLGKDGEPVAPAELAELSYGLDQVIALLGKAGAGSARGSAPRSH